MDQAGRGKCPRGVCGSCRVGAPLHGLSAGDFADQQSFFRFRHDPHGFDILPQVTVMDFDQAWERRVEVVVDEIAALRANCISADDLVAAKLASGRPQDLADAEAVRLA